MTHPVFKICYHYCASCIKTYTGRNFADLQFSSEDEADDIPLSEGDPDPMPDDDSQQAAEAMVQLGNIGYYPPASGVTNEQGMSKLLHSNFHMSPIIVT